jgi:thymidylate synthase ThyX
MTITAKIIADSINADTKKRITTYELEYPRIIHAELLTHRIFSRNSASSRAIPIETMLGTIKNDTAVPSHWGKNQAGMQADIELSGEHLENVQRYWNRACTDATHWSLAMHKEGAHKQVANRLTEPFQHMKVVLTSTEFNNFWWLRDHKDADPTIAELAKKMLIEFDSSKPKELQAGEWHLPYISTYRKTNNTLGYYTHSPDNNELVELTEEEAIIVSVSCCAQVSYRRSDTSLDKAKMIYNRLIESEPCHASPLEHVAKCLNVGLIDFYEYSIPDTWEDGITHMDKHSKHWSNNLQGWIQYRALVPNNYKQG